MDNKTQIFRKSISFFHIHTNVHTLSPSLHQIFSYCNWLPSFSMLVYSLSQFHWMRFAFSHSHLSLILLQLIIILAFLIHFSYTCIHPFVNIAPITSYIRPMYIMYSVSHQMTIIKTKQVCLIGWCEKCDRSNSNKSTSIKIVPPQDSIWLYLFHSRRASLDSLNRGKIFILIKLRAQFDYIYSASVRVSLCACCCKLIFSEVNSFFSIPLAMRHSQHNKNCDSEKRQTKTSTESRVD